VLFFHKFGLVRFSWIPGQRPRDFYFITFDDTPALLIPVCCIFACRFSKTQEKANQDTNKKVFLSSGYTMNLSEMRKRFLTLLFVFVLLGFEVQSQQVLVKDLNTGIPVEGVVVTSLNYVTQTDHSGVITLDAVPESSRIRFYHPSYIPFEIVKRDLQKFSFIVNLTESPVRLSEIVVSVSRQKVLKSQIANKVDIIRSGEIMLAHMPTTADIAGLSGEVFIQKTQQGGGSPMIRGFSANRLLLVVDGVRINNAIYRSGNLQNIVSIDPYSLESMEVVPGPGSVIYGSDALGGVLSMNTLNPEFSNYEKKASGNLFMLRYSSASAEKTMHGRWNSAGKKWGFLLSGSFSSFEDLRMGNYGPEEYLRPEYVNPKYFNGRDTVLKNNNLRVQRFSGYSQGNMLAKLRFKPFEKLDITLGTIYSRISNVPRYDRLIVYKGQRLRYGDWYYGPQTWLLSSATIRYHKKHLIFDDITFISGMQIYGESRHDRNIDYPDLFHRKEKLTIFTASIDFAKTLFDKLSLTYGMEGSYETIRSTGEAENLLTHFITEIAPRYPDHSKYKSVAAYMNGRYKVLDNLTLHGGLRYTGTYLEGVFPLQFYDFPFSGFQSANQAWNGNMGIVYNFTAHEKVNLLFSSGFRSPNIDDIAKVFDSEPGHVMVPNPDLEPEFVRNLEAGIVKQLGNSVQIEVTTFYIRLKNAMVRRDYLFNGRDSLLYNHVMSKVEALVNTDAASIYGGTGSIGYLVTGNLKMKNTLTFIRGKDSDGLPVRHVPPVYGYSAFIYDKFPWFAEMNIRYNGSIPFSRLASDERDKPYLYLSDKNGNPYSPGWFTINLSLCFDISEKLKISCGVENILDSRYRPYSSGIAAAGRNLIISVTGKL
jgi:hemoglobin/transferrin/lactoferrin receptor protein